jgi:hypothetical protein
MTLAAALAALLALQESCIHKGTGFGKNHINLKERAILEKVNSLWLDPERLHDLLDGPCRKPLERLEHFLSNAGLRSLLEKGTSCIDWSNVDWSNFGSDDEVLTCENASIGMRVCRGPHWRGGAEDGHGAGTVVGMHASKAGAAVEVEWDTHCKGRYSAGLLSCFELTLCPPDFAKKEDWASTLKSEICEVVVAAALHIDPDESFDALMAKISGTWEDMRYAAMLLCPMKDTLPDAVVHKLGEPWLARPFLHTAIDVNSYLDVSLQPRKLHQQLLDGRLDLIQRLGFTWSLMRLAVPFQERLDMEESASSQKLLSFKQIFGRGPLPIWLQDTPIPLLDKLIRSLVCDSRPFQNAPQGSMPRQGSSQMLPSLLMRTAMPQRNPPFMGPHMGPPGMMPGAMQQPYLMNYPFAPMPQPFFNDPWMMLGAMPYTYPMGPPWMMPEAWPQHRYHPEHDREPYFDEDVEPYFDP